MQHVLV